MDRAGVDGTGVDGAETWRKRGKTKFYTAHDADKYLVETEFASRNTFRMNKPPTSRNHLKNRFVKPLRGLEELSSFSNLACCYDHVTSYVLNNKPEVRHTGLILVLTTV